MSDLQPQFTIGQKVKAIAFTDCFGKDIPERCDLTVTEIRKVDGQSIPSYYRVKADADNGEYIEGAERFFDHEFQSMHGTDSCWHCDSDYAQH